MIAVKNGSEIIDITLKKDCKYLDDNYSLGS